MAQMFEIINVKFLGANRIIKTEVNNKGIYFFNSSSLVRHLLRDNYLYLINAFF